MRILVSILFVLCLGLVDVDAHGPVGIPGGIMQRVRLIAVPYADNPNSAEAGTVLIINYKNREYLITAAHVIAPIKGTRGRVKIRTDAGFADLDVEVIKHDIADVAVLIPSSQKKPMIGKRGDLRFELSGDGATIGQSLWFLGFPFGSANTVQFNAGDGQIKDVVFPFVKHAILSSMVTGQDGRKLVLLDGMNNVGFSGGPVLFFHQQENTWKVLGIITQFNQSSKAKVVSDGVVNFSVLVNSGIAIADNVIHVIDLIEANPRGLPIEP